MKDFSHIENILANIQRKGNGMPYFGDSRYVPHKLSAENFHSIHEKEEQRISFIDGGNAPIISSPEFDLSLLRVYYSVYLGTKKTECARKDYYVAVTAEASDRLVYNAEIISLDGSSPETILFDANDESLKMGNFSAEISHIAGIVRRFLEWKMAEKACKSARLLVMDGSLQTGYTGENKYANDAYSSAVKSKCIFSGLSKTSSLITTTGKSLMAVINSMGPSGSWFYRPICEISHPDHKAEITAVKLHPNAPTCYRYEILNEQALHAEEAVALLAQNAKDWRYPGYPYGLMDADALARITEQEQNYHKAVFSGIRKHTAVSAKDAHDIINNLVR